MAPLAPERAFAKLFSYLLLLAIVVFVVGCTKSSKHDAELLTFRLSSNSMSPTFFGPHHQVTCKECGNSWKIAAETVGSEPGQAVCNMCGSAFTFGDLQLGLQLSASSLKPNHVPQRLDCIVFDVNAGKESDARQWTCKRVWGLPGETIELRNGELIVDGQLFQKDAHQLLRVAIPVASYSSGGPSDLFWLGMPKSTEIAPRPSAKSLAGTASSLSLKTGETIRWKRPVLDDYPEDLSTPRNLIPVNDLLFEFEFEDHRNNPADQTGTDQTGADQIAANKAPRLLVLELGYRGARAEIQCMFGDIDPNSIPELPVNSRGSRNILFNPQRIYCGGWDGELKCLVNQEIDALEYQSTPNDSPLALGAFDPTYFNLSVLNGPVRIKKLAVMRDLYLRANERDLSNGQPGPIQLGADEYFVVGDNLPISIDSRNGLGNLKSRQVWGVVK